MASLAVPQQLQPENPTKPLASNGSASTLHRSAIEHDDNLAPTTHSRRASMAETTPSAINASPGAPTSAAAQAGLIPLPEGQMQADAENAALIAPVDWKETDHYAGNHVAGSDPNAPTTTLLMGKDLKPFHVPTAMLKERSSYFKKLLAENTGHFGSTTSAAQMSFDDLDEFGMGLFMHWLSSRGNLQGPHDFHSLAHYLSLYVLARKFEVEPLENQVMDHVRHYYSAQNMTAPAYRLEYIYTYTHTPNKMRDFLLSTAAFRALEDSHAPANLVHAGPTLHRTFCASGSYVSESIKNVLMKNPEMAMDFVETLVKLHRCGEHDARHGKDCEWHVHDQTKRCKEDTPEPWQSDGAADYKPAEPKKDELKPAAPGGPTAPITPTPKSAAPAATPTKPADPPKAAEDPKNDDGPFKNLGKKMKGHIDAAKDKLHAKKDKAPERPADKPKDEKKPTDDKKPTDKAKDDKSKDAKPVAPPAKK